MADENDTGGGIVDPWTLWVWMRAFFWIAIALYVVFAAANAVIAAIWLGALVISTSAADLIDTSVRILGYVLQGVYCVCAFLALRVLYRLAKNARNGLASNINVLASVGEVPSPGWTVGSFFIPIASFVMPPIMIGQIWRATFALRGTPKNPSGAIGTWWVAFLLTGIMGGVALFVLSRRAADASVESTVAMLVFCVALYIGRALTALLFLSMVSALVHAQSRRDIDTSAFD